MRHRCFDEVPRTIELVRVTQIRPASLWLDESKVQVEVSIGLRGFRQKSHDVVQQGVQSGVRLQGEGMAGSLDPLGEIGVPENVRLMGHARLPFQPEGLQVALDIHLLVDSGDGRRPIELLAGRPKTIAQRYPAQRDGKEALHALYVAGVGRKRQRHRPFPPPG